MGEKFDVDSFIKKYSDAPPKEQLEVEVEKEMFAQPVQNSKGFDTDRFIAKSTAKPKSDYSILESGARGAAQGVTLGLSDELLAAGKAAISPGKFSENFPKYLAEERVANVAASEANPKTFAVTNFAGNIVPAVASGGGGILAALAKSALAGGLSSVGESNAIKGKDLSEITDVEQEFGKGATIGTAIQGVFSLLGKGISKLTPQAIKDTAAKQAVKAAGAKTAEFRALDKMGKTTEIGRELLDKKVVTLAANLDDIAERAAANKQIAGEQIGAALKNVDDMVATSIRLVDEGKIGANLSDKAKTQLKDKITQEFQFSNKRIGERIRTEIVDKIKDFPTFGSDAQKYIKLAEDFESKGAFNLTKANEMKALQGAKTRFASDSVPESFKQELYSIIREEIENVVGKTGNLEAGVTKGLQALPKQAGEELVSTAERNSKALSDYLSAKKTYGAMAEAENIAAKRLGAEQSNNLVGLGSKVLTAGGVASGSPAAGIAMGGLSEAFRRYGNNAAAVGLNGIANALEKSPQKLKDYAPQLLNAMKDGKASLLLTHQLLLKEDPDYRQIVLENTDNLMQRKMIANLNKGK